MSETRALGVCYYPEHWPEARWQTDATMMRDAGLTWVRIGEFSWGLIEPEPGQLNWGFLDRAVRTLKNAGLKVVMGTPSATPPRWMLDKYPDMLAVDAEGRPRGFGSRRHYCFSHAGYREEAVRITDLMAERYGAEADAWQTDNEYGCHDTVISYSEAARVAFQQWLEARYGTVEALNAAWGNVFWSMQYQRFDQIGLPNLTVTEPNPAHRLDFHRFSSDQVVVFNRALAEAIRAHSEAPICHNYMGRITEFDHFKTGHDLDFASWDSYPLGFLEDRVGASPEHQRNYARQGDPDFQAFHHDLYRAVGKGRWWVMEQQPGPVNWAPYNPAPLPGMVRLWTWEAFAHGAETVTYFRWRQLPFGQEQLHAGLLRPDAEPAQGLLEAQEVASELADAPAVSAPHADVALVFDYEAEWAWHIQPQGQGLSYFDLILAWYRSLRKLGLSIDIVPPDGSGLDKRKLILAPGLMHMPQAFADGLARSDAVILLGPRTAARTENFAIPPGLPPDVLGLDVKVSYLETLRPDCPEPLDGGGHVILWREALETTAEPLLTGAGSPVAVQQGRMIYCGAWLDGDARVRLLREACDLAGVETTQMPKGVRRRRTASEEFWFNHGAEAAKTPHGTLPPAGVLRRVL